MALNLGQHRIVSSYQRLLQISPDDGETVLDGTGSVVPSLHISGGLRTQVKHLTTGNNVIGSEDSGKLITIAHASNALTASLPSASSCVGCTYTFVTQVARTADFRIDGEAADVFRGISITAREIDGLATISGSHIPGDMSSSRYVVYDEGNGIGGNGSIGDRLTLDCDGTYYYVKAEAMGNYFTASPVWSGSST